MHLHGFDLDQLRAYPHGISDGDLPVLILKKECDESIENIKEVVWAPLQKEFKEKRLFPSMEHV